MDGARLSNAAAFLDCGFREITRDAGIDVLSFGGTKNGMMFGEAIIFFEKELARNFKYIRKQGMQLASKMRFIAAQFNSYLDNKLWLKNALHANRMAKMLHDKVSELKGIVARLIIFLVSLSFISSLIILIWLIISLSNFLSFLPILYL